MPAWNLHRQVEIAFKRRRRSFTSTFKTEVERFCQVGGRNIGQVASDLDLAGAALLDWVHRAIVDAKTYN